MGARARGSATFALAAALGAGAAAGCVGLIGEAPAAGVRADGGGEGGGSGPARIVGESRAARLTRAEYERTLRAALGATVADGLRYDYLPGDGRAGYFATNALLNVDDDAVEKYRTVAELAGARFGTEAARDPAGVVGCAAPSPACTAALVDRVGAVLFRRALTDAERAAYVALFDQERASGGSAADAAGLVATALLQSPNFLYRFEVGAPTDDPALRRLDGAEIAARLAAFLWLGAPDATLAEAARRGDLGTTAGIEREARRMVRDRQSDLAIAKFHTSWLGVDAIATLSNPDYPELATLRGDMARETGDFAAYVFRNGDARLATLLTAPYTVASDALATLYGGARDATTGVVRLPPAERAGLLTHAGFLATHAPSPSTAAVHRGRLIREGFFCQSLPNPPPIDRVIAPDPTRSARQQLEQRTSAASCNACHQLMNPQGFLFEPYDGLGRYRTMDGPFPVDAAARILQSDITAPLDGAIELARALAASPTVDRCVARQWLRFALGRVEAPEDEPSLDAAYARYTAAGRDLRELLVGIAVSDAFRYRRVPAP